MSQLISLAEIIETLSKKWTPHEGQIPVGSALFYEGFKNIFFCAGRNTGKTSLSAYCCTRWAMQYPGSENYIFGPYSNQMREILWASQRIQDFVPEEWIQSINNTEMRITLNNGSFIKLDGSDNDQARRGIKPSGVIVYDEFKDHKLSFVKAMEPNRAAKNAPALFIGTPPEFDNHFVTYMEYAKRSPKWFFHHAPTEVNPHIPKSWLSDEKERLITIGDEEEWIREYMAIFVRGGKRHIFPQFLKYESKPLADILPESREDWEMIVWADPASASTFGVLFLLFNPYLRKVIVVDEIYETMMANMTAQSIYGRMQKKVASWEKLGIREFRFGYDEAATWFANEVAELCDWYLEPTHKAQNPKESGISLIRDLFYNESIEVAMECKNFISEMNNYIKDDKGRIPKENDHLIDCLRYALAALGFEFTHKTPPIKKDKDMERRFHKMEDDFANSMMDPEID